MTGAVVAFVFVAAVAGAVQWRRERRYRAAWRAWWKEAGR